MWASIRGRQASLPGLHAGARMQPVRDTTKSRALSRPAAGTFESCDSSAQAPGGQRMRRVEGVASRILLSFKRRRVGSCTSVLCARCPVAAECLAAALRGPVTSRNLGGAVRAGASDTCEVEERTGLADEPAR